jgi:phospholipid/cholesterol/gamma-HCH transport system substrate-binding protein
MARELSWSDVRGGLIALAVVVAIAVGVLKYSRVGALRGDTFHLYALVGEARGVTPGSEVWLSGQKVGKITRIEFQPATSDTSRRILIEMEVLSEFRPAMHRNATAQIRAGGSFIGAVVVYVSPGTVASVEMADNDTILTQPQVDVEGATGQFGAATRELPAILGNVRVLTAQLRSTEGTVGAVLNGPGLGQLGLARIRMARVVNRLTGGGTAGLIAGGGLTTRAQRVMARADSVRALLASDRTSLGRLRRDSTLVTEVADIRRQLDQVQRALDTPSGTAGRVLRDSALTQGVASAQQEMTLLFADLKKHPFRYLSF